MTITHRYFSEDILKQAAILYLEYDGNIAECANAAGVTRDTMRRRVKQLEENFPHLLEEQAVSLESKRAFRGEIGGPPIPETAIPPEGFVIRRNSGQYDADGNLERQWIESGQGNTDGYQIPEGHVVKGESTLLDSGGNVIAKWIKTKAGVSSEGLVEALVRVFQNYDGAAPIVPKPAHSNEQLLTLYPLPDLHFGQYSWGLETGADYDVDIAAATALSAIDELLDRSRPTKHATILGLGDYFHMNDQTNATPAHKNRLDADTRFARVLALGAKLATQIIDRVARKHEEVEVVFLPGNHDPEAALALTVALSLFYSNNPRIKVRMDPGVVWCRRFGNCFLAATHGHTMKPARFRSYLTARHARDWGLSRFRNGFMGHIHHETADEEGGIRIESFQTPAAPDDHATSHGYVSGRSLSAITFSAERGEIGRHRSNIEVPFPPNEQWQPFEDLAAA
jgi:hypothetical protein